MSFYDMSDLGGAQPRFMPRKRGEPKVAVTPAHLANWYGAHPAFVKGTAEYHARLAKAAATRAAKKAMGAVPAVPRARAAAGLRHFDAAQMHSVGADGIDHISHMFGDVSLGRAKRGGMVVGGMPVGGMGVGGMDVGGMDVGGRMRTARQMVAQAVAEKHGAGWSDILKTAMGLVPMLL